MVSSIGIDNQNLSVQRFEVRFHIVVPWAFVQKALAFFRKSKLVHKRKSKAKLKYVPRDFL